MRLPGSPQTTACFISKNGKWVGWSHSDWLLNANTSQPITLFQKKVLVASNICPSSAALRTNMDTHEGQIPAQRTFNFRNRSRLGRRSRLQQLTAALCFRLSATLVSMKTKVPVNQQRGSTRSHKPARPAQLVPRFRPVSPRLPLLRRRFPEADCCFCACLRSAGARQTVGV